MILNVVVCSLVGLAGVAVTGGANARAQGLGSGTGEFVSASPVYRQALERGNSNYNDSRYDDAIGAYTQAIQASPHESDAYRNMARAYFWQGSYPAALAYYDIYLRTFPDAPDADQVQRERRLTSDRASTPWTLPEEQRVAMRSLEGALEAGDIYTREGGGAWNAYQTLLRTGYAQPGLATLRMRLTRQLIDEFDRALVTAPDQPAPQLAIEDWEVQRFRLESARKTALVAQNVEQISKRDKIHEAATALLLSRFEEAATKAELAARDNPELLFLHWFQITALLRANRAQQALSVLDTLEPMLRQQAPAQLDYHKVVNAMILQRLGRHDEATDAYTRILRGR